MNSTMKIREQDLVENPTARVPICLVLDTSGSMAGEPIKELNEGIKLFFTSILKDDIAQWSAEICIVEFNSSPKKVLDFDSIQRQFPPSFTADGSTAMGEAVNCALDLLDERKKEYQKVGVDYYQPWMVLMTDGMPTDDPQAASKRACELVNKRKLTVFPIAIGKDADIDTLKKFSPKRNPLRLKGLNFRQFFEWLSASVQKVSESTPGQAIQLDEASINGWALLNDTKGWGKLDW